MGGEESEKNQGLNKWVKRTISQDRKNKVQSFFELESGFNLEYSEMLPEMY